MNCHGNHGDHGEHQKSEKKGFMSHGLLMVLCCAIPIVLLLALPYLNIKSPGLQSVVTMGVFLLCPLMHVGMMFFMHKGHKGEQENQSKDCH